MIAINQNVPRVLVVGLDGATFDVLAPLAEAGKMPNLAHLMRASALAVVRSTTPAITPVAWTTYQTGCDPSDHGIFDYRYLDHRRRILLLNHAGRIRCPNLFEAVSANGGEVVSLNLPMTYPAAAARGIVVGGLDSPSMEAALAPYPEFAARVRATGARYDLDTVWRRKPTSFEELAGGVAQTNAVLAGQVAAARVADLMVDWRLMHVQFQVLDAFEHRCWHLLGVDEACTAPRAWIAKAQQSLRILDQCLGELVELAECRKAAVVVVSDHGFGPFREKISLPELLSRRGLMVKPRGGNTGYWLRRTAWKLRKSVWRRLRPGSSTAHLTRPLAGLLPIDWRHSRALALHGDLGALVYLNSPERFGAGPVTTPRQREQALAELAAAFGEARHPETGERLFVESFGTAETFVCDPLERMWPDLIAVPAPGFHTRHKFDPVPRLLRPDATLVATHRPDGVLMVQAPGIAAGRACAAELRDVAPTILHLLGITPPSHMTGRVLWQLLSGAPRAVAARSSEARPLARLAGITASDQASVEARLRDLGYLD